MHGWQWLARFNPDMTLARPDRSMSGYPPGMPATRDADDEEPHEADGAWVEPGSRLRTSTEEAEAVIGQA